MRIPSPSGETKMERADLTPAESFELDIAQISPSLSLPLSKYKQHRRLWQSVRLHSLP